MNVKADQSRFAEAGGHVAVVTMGTPQQAAAFRQQHQLPFPVLADPQRAAYQAFRLRRGTLGQVAGPRMWLAGLKATFRGGVGRPSGDVWQMPGAFVIDRHGIVRFAHYPSHTGDLPAHGAMLQAIQLAVGKGRATQPTVDEADPSDPQT